MKKGKCNDIEVYHSTHDGYHAKYGNMFAWKIITHSVNPELKYQTAELKNDCFCNHKIVDTFEEALDRIRLEKVVDNG